MPNGFPNLQSHVTCHTQPALSSAHSAATVRLSRAREQSSVQPEPQPLSFSLNMKPAADPTEMISKLKQVETRIADLRDKQIEHAQAGRTDEVNKLTTVLSKHITAYKKGREFVMKMFEAKRAAAGCDGPCPFPHAIAHGAASAAGTTQPAASAIAALLQMFNPAATHIPTQANLSDVFETRDVQWVGTFVWQSTDTARKEKKEVRAQIVASALLGNPYAIPHPFR